MGHKGVNLPETAQHSIGEMPIVTTTIADANASSEEEVRRWRTIPPGSERLICPHMDGLMV